MIKDTYKQEGGFDSHALPPISSNNSERYNSDTPSKPTANLPPKSKNVKSNYLTVDEELELKKQKIEERRRARYTYVEGVRPPRKTGLSKKKPKTKEVNCANKYNCFGLYDECVKTKCDKRKECRKANKIITKVYNL